MSVSYKSIQLYYRDPATRAFKPLKTEQGNIEYKFKINFIHKGIPESISVVHKISNYDKSKRYSLTGEAMRIPIYYQYNK